nr:PAS domain-containing protein [Dehalococcoides mccartyi]
MFSLWRSVRGGADIEGTTTLINIIRDTTERKQAENALNKSLQNYQVLFNSVTDAILVHQPAADYSAGKFIEVNDAALAMLGYSRKELLQITPHGSYVQREISS